MADDLPLLTFNDAAAFEAWLAEQPPNAPGCWVRFAKKGAPEATVDKDEAIDSALIHGWVDSQIGRVDEHYFKTRFTPRKPKSIWSQLNRERVGRLEAAGRMAPAGRAQVETAKADGRWNAAYASASRAEPCAELMAALVLAPEAKAMFEGLDGANRFAVLWRIDQTKTPAKRTAKIAEMVAKLTRGEIFHPPRKA
jgi:uncharacterized protein YdeI (YjbR/CyaY-like superfamily)